MSKKRIAAGIMAVVLAAGAFGNFDVQWINGNGGPVSVSAAESVYKTDYYTLYYEKYDDHVVITRGVSGAFSFFTLPDMIEGLPVTEIGDRPFDNFCTTVYSLKLPKYIKKIGKDAFKDFLITEMKLPEGIEEIGENAFNNIHISEIHIPASVKVIGEGAFSGAYSLTLDSENTDFCMKNGVLYNADRTVMLYVNRDQEYDGTYDNTFSALKVPDTVKRIGAYAFGDHYTEKELIIPEGIEELGDYAVSGEFTNVVIPSTLKKAGVNAFGGYHPDNLEIAEGNTSFYMNDDVLYSKEEKRALFIKGSSDKSSIAVEPGTEIIDPYAFSECTSMRNITIPDGITSLPKCVFNKCTGLSYADLPDTLEEIGEFAFNECSSLKKIILPGSVTIIRRSAFEHSGLTEIVLPSELKTIEHMAFIGSKLSEVRIPEKTEYIGNYAFCTYGFMKKAYMSPDFHAYNDTTFDKETDIIYYEKSGYTNEDGIVFSSDMKTIISYPKNRNESRYSIPSSVTCIGEGAFSNCYSLQNIYIPESVTEIGAHAFEKSDLRMVSIPESVVSVGDNAFSGCDDMESAYIPDTVKYIGKEAFSGCYSLSSVHLPSGLKKLPERLFTGCNSLTSYTLPDSLEELHYGDLPAMIRELCISEKTVNIDDDAFEGLSYLKNICGKSGSYAQTAAENAGISFTDQYPGYAADVNSDDKINIIDMITLKNAVLEGRSSDKNDVNSDGKVNAADLLMMKKILLDTDDKKGLMDISLRKYNIAAEIPDDQTYYIRTEEELEKVLSTELFGSDDDISEKISVELKGLLDENVIVIYTVCSKLDELMTFNLERASATNSEIHASLRRKSYSAAWNDGPGKLYAIAVPREIYSGQKLDVSVSRISGALAAKPVIYLYPEEETDINVKVHLDRNSRFTSTYPKYPEDTGWNVTAEPDSTIYDENGREYSYLFWEAGTSHEWDMSEGFVVKGEDTVEFLQEKLEYLGLTPKEYNDFIVYWMPKMESNKYNLVKFQTDEYEEMAKLEITPEPDSIQRVFMTFKALDEYQKIPEQKLEPFERHGYTVIEWGGSEIE